MDFISMDLFTIMKTPTNRSSHHSAFTLLEMSVVILVLLSLLGIGLFSSKKIDEWKLARQATEELRTVHSAQRLFLADHPTKAVSTIVPADIIPYLPSNATALPIVKSLTGTNLTILVDRIPPRFSNGSNAIYDPSGPLDKPATFEDSLWDVGLPEE